MLGTQAGLQSHLRRVMRSIPIRMFYEVGEGATSAFYQNEGKETRSNLLPERKKAKQSNNKKSTKYMTSQCSRQWTLTNKGQWLWKDNERQFRAPDVHSAIVPATYLLWISRIWCEKGEQIQKAGRSRELEFKEVRLSEGRELQTGTAEQREKMREEFYRGLLWFLPQIKWSENVCAEMTVALGEHKG